MVPSCCHLTTVALACERGQPCPVLSLPSFSLLSTHPHNTPSIIIFLQKLSSPYSQQQLFSARRK